MTPIPTAVTFTPAEQAALSGAGGNPYPDEKLEMTDADTSGIATTGPEGDAGNGVGPGNPEDGKAGDTSEPDQRTDEADGDGEEEVTDVVDGTNPDAPSRRKMIAFGAYEKKRIEANKAKEELGKLREQVAYLSGLSQNAKPAPQTQQPQTEELSLTPPDKAKEPEKYLAWLEAAAAKSLTLEQRTKAQSEQQTQFAQINQVVFEHEQAFIKGSKDAGIDPHPDFNDAVAFLQDKHRAELEEAGYKPHEVSQIMAARAQDVALRALQAGKSPAERVYSLAKLNGYKRAAPAKVETEAEKIARQAEKQAKAGKSISDLPGGESKAGLTAETLANMDPKEFLRAWSSGEAKKVMGWTE